MNRKECECCYWCALDNRIDIKETGCGIGRMIKPLNINEGLYKLYFLSNLNKDFRKNVQLKMEGKLNDESQDTDSLPA